VLHNTPAALLLFASLALTGRAADLGADLLAAAKQRDAAAVQALLAKGADVNAKSSYGATSLSFAANKGHLAVVKVLLQHKADVKSPLFPWVSRVCSWPRWRVPLAEEQALSASVTSTDWQGSRCLEVSDLSRLRRPVCARTSRGPQ
jgi:hypothetical protein